MPKGPKQQRLNIFLIKEDVDISDVLRNDVEGLASAAIAPGLGFEGRIITKGALPNPPRWLKFVQTGTREQLGSLLNQSASCLIIIEINNRLFAVAFGFGRLDERQIVRRFGMIVTLNVVHRDGIRSVDREEFDTIQRKTRSQTSVSSSMDNFGLNVQRDLLRSVTGCPEDQAFASHLTGADNLIMTVPIRFDQLGQKCLEALAHYESDTYRERYPWIDNFTRITDPTRTVELDNALVETLRTGGRENIFLAPPDALDVQEHRGFRYHYERNATSLHADLKLEDFLSGVPSDQIIIANLKKWRIREYTSSDDTPSRQYQVYEAFIHEVAQGPKLYALSFGEWFEISQDHVTTVNNQLRQIADHDELILIDAAVGETEGDYNTRAALASNGALALLDAQPVVYGGGRSSIEICDLLSIDRIFVHVKAKTKSSTLSHLFAQGLNSAQAFRDATFRRLALGKCPQSHSTIFQGEPRASDHTITYSIMTQAAGDLRDALPFFSKQSLANASVLLMNMGYQVRLKKVRVV
jgi:uncharacterized protein (TIGR04141 family)